MWTHLAVPVGHSEGHVGRHEEKQRLLLRELLPQTLNHLGPFGGSLNANTHTDLIRLSGGVSRHCCPLQVASHLLSLEVVLDLRHSDLHGVDFLVLDQWDRSRLTVLNGLEG